MCEWIWFVQFKWLVIVYSLCTWSVLCVLYCSHLLYWLGFCSFGLRVCFHFPVTLPVLLVCWGAELHKHISDKCAEHDHIRNTGHPHCQSSAIIITIYTASVAVYLMPFTYLFKSFYVITPSLHPLLVWLIPNCTLQAILSHFNCIVYLAWQKDDLISMLTDNNQN